ncbi:hypothetical protein OEIGOIKO_03231 [Streptomyces chrestomyceticus JCM 4735]|uniref:Uncharacterized protein n=1 Tax=Streptomyces chrestomyceticus JCM 4735 TaxID=1306181 RepID=A0A7U9KVF6_9ACTN|nr:hypothetical protein [Streptomyces chrestomyceticus]GCD35488.1 hypothetical protein OEIGOIKO_03231 [Streptomyces chrestomyceticus JCM 4735]
MWLTGSTTAITTAALHTALSSPSTTTAPSPLRFLFLAAGPLLLIAAVGLLLRRRSRLRDLAQPLAIPRAVFAAARRADEAGIRERAAEEVARLAGYTQRNGAAPAATERARESCATAEALLRQARGVPDLAGVFALVHEGCAALDGSKAPLPLCFFHPLHGPAIRRIPWRPSDDGERFQVGACATCVRALRARREPDTLTDERAGRPVPYFDVPPEHSLWSATGYGSLLTDTSLTTHVQRELDLAR